MRVTTLPQTELDAARALWNSPEQLHPCSAELFAEKTRGDAGALPELRFAAFAQSAIVGFCIAALRPEARRSHIKFIAVDADTRRQGIARALLLAAEQALAERGAEVVRVDEAAPNYLTPGIHQQNVGARQFFEACGYETVDEALHMTAELGSQDFSTTAEERSLADRQIAIRRATPSDRECVMSLLRQNWPAWRPEIESTFLNEPISLHLAIHDGKALGFAAYDANNRGTGWFGPMGTEPAATGQGIGRVLLRRVLADLQTQGHARATIPWVDPVGFYQRHCGATISDRFWRMEKTLEDRKG